MIDQLPVTDTIWGIDRYTSSETRGHLVVPIVYLWKQPGAKPIKDNLTGAVRHSTLATVTRHKMYQGEAWYFVKCEVRHKGKLFPQHGWCKGRFLLMLGDAYTDWGDGVGGSLAAALPFQQARGANV